MNLEEHVHVYPDKGNYIRPYDDISSDDSPNDVWEKESLVPQKSPEYRKPLPPSTIAQVFIHVLLVLANVAFCLLYLNYGAEGRQGPRIANGEEHSIAMMLSIY